MKPLRKAKPAAVAIGRVEPQRLRIARTPRDSRLDCLVHIPERLNPTRPVLVAVHGISRNASEQLEAFRAGGEASGLVIVAPCFDRETFPDFQRLGREGRGARADRALDDALARLRKRFGLENERVLLFGYSGGGQFVHRYLMAHPERVEAAVVAAAGWYTFPDSRCGYPRGTRVGDDLEGVALQERRFLQVPALVVVGSEDTERDAKLRRSAAIDRQQGRTRVERAERWVAAMTRAAERKALPPRVGFCSLPGVGHSFAEARAAGIAELSFRFFAQRGAFGLRRSED